MKLDFPKGITAGNVQPEEKPNSLFDIMTAMSRSLAEALARWTPEEKKIFIMALTKIRWSKSGNSNTVELDKREMIEALGLKIDSNKQSVYLRKAVAKLKKDSEIHWTNPIDKEQYEDADLIIGQKGRRGKLLISFNPEYMPHLENLVHNTPYLTYWSSDIYAFKSKFTFALFEELRQHYDSRYINNYRTYSTKELKEIFGLSKDKYVRKDGSFDRSNFEKRCLDVAIGEINQSETMSFMPIGTSSNGKMSFYEKVKKNGHVAGYKFRYLVRTVQKDDDIVSTQEEGQIEGQQSLFDDYDF